MEGHLFPREWSGGTFISSGEAFISEGVEWRGVSFGVYCFTKTVHAPVRSAVFQALATSFKKWLLLLDQLDAYVCVILTHAFQLRYSHWSKSDIRFLNAVHI